MDVKIFRAINLLSGRSPFLDKWMILISNRIRYVYILILFLLWCKKQSRKITIYAGISVVITLLIKWVINLLHFKPRPFMEEPVEVLIPSKTDSSFPSKHTLLAFAAATSVFCYQRVLGSIMWMMSVLTGFSRIWVGHHYPSDIFGSTLIGTLTSMIIHKVFHPRK